MPHRRHQLKQARRPASIRSYSMPACTRANVETNERRRFTTERRRAGSDAERGRGREGGEGSLRCAELQRIADRCARVRISSGPDPRRRRLDRNDRLTTSCVSTGLHGSLHGPAWTGTPHANRSVPRSAGRNSSCSGCAVRILSAWRSHAQLSSGLLCGLRQRLENGNAISYSLPRAPQQQRETSGGN